MNIAHISDLHFGTEIPEVVDGLASRLNELEPDLVVASGDFTMAGRHKEYEQASKFLTSIPSPIIATPGNHDMPVYQIIERFISPFRRYRNYIEPITENRLINDTVAILSINTARPWDLSFDWSHGRFSTKQIKQADRFFAEHRSLPTRMLVVHHPFFVPEDMPGFRTIRRSEEMLDVLARHHVQLVLAGHLHRAFHTKRRIDLDPGGDGPHADIAVLQVSTATSSRHRDQPNSFSLLELDGGNITQTMQSWDGTQFAPTEPEPLLGV